MRRRSLSAKLLLSMVFVAGLQRSLSAQVATVPNQSSSAAQTDDNASPTEDPDTAAVKERDIVRVGQPWLRISPPGHTATVQALAFSSDSRRLFSAGLDKVVQVWDLAALPVGGRARDLKRTFLRERAIRWQVSRGPRGSLFALATAPDGTLAMAGYGAMGSTGEILLVNPVDGSLIKVLEGHRQTVCSLAFTSDGATLASIDTDGECRLWQSGPWTSRVIFPKDAVTYGPARAALIQRQPLLRPLAVIKNTHLVLPVLASGADQQKVRWQLQVVAIATGKVTRTFKTPHASIVTSVAVTADGNHMASADLAGGLYFYDLAQGEEIRLADGPAVKSLAFSPGGETLAVGTAVSSASGTSLLQFWDIPTRKITASRTLKDHVQACGFSPDGKFFACTGGPKNEVFVERLAQGAKPAIPLAGGSRKILKVAFASAQPFYRVAFGVDQPDAGGDAVKLTESFDPAHGQLGNAGPQGAADWLPANWMAGNWRAQVSADTSSVQLYEGKAPRGVVRLDPQTQGFVRSTCWIPASDGKPFAIAVGTNKQNLVCVYRLATRGDCPLLRQFRGHQDFVTSISISRDLRLLVSGSADGTMQFWSLSDYQQGPLSGRWGAGFQVVKGKLVVQSINEAGPLFGKGLRAGDAIQQLRWREGDQDRSEASPQKMLDRLRDVPWFTQVEFGAMRATGVPLKFQLVPAWQALASLFVSEDREWAFWTPDGYYGASANGHTLFGWQVNRGLYALPNFYRADQFRRKLERPDLLEQLLTSGSLAAAMRNAKQAAADEPDRVLVSQIAATPTISILSPKPGALVENRKVKVRAQVRMPAEGKIAQTRVFANGVVARSDQLISQALDKETGALDLVYEWDAVLPRESRNLIQVFVLTEAGTTAFDRVFVEQPAPAPIVNPKLYVLALGVNDYQDPEIEDLDYSVADATALVASIEKESRGLYELVPPIQLMDDAVTRTNCRSTFTELSEKLKDSAGPDDLLVIFMAGHGEVNPRDQIYHYICHDARIDTLLDGRGSLTWNDFQPLADIPCRKVVLLDTCHSGAIQGSRRQNSLAARDFQENLLLTLAAAADDEASQERTEWRHGAFTKVLLDGLAGSADSSHDGVVMLDELVDYAHQTVPTLTGDFQHPTAAPRELMEFIALPLAEAADTAPPQPARLGETNAGQ